MDACGGPGEPALHEEVPEEAAAATAAPAAAGAAAAGEPAAGAVWIRGPWNPDLRERLLPLEDRNSRIEVVTELALVEVFAPPDGCLFGAQARMSHSRLELLFRRTKV